MRNTLTYPHETVAPSIETLFVDGIRFDICEVIPSAYDMLYDFAGKKKPSNRFFVCVEERWIYKWDYANEMAQFHGDTWRHFCFTKSECKSYVMDFQNAIDFINKQYERIDRSPNFKVSLLPQIAKKKQWVKTNYQIVL